MSVSLGSRLRGTLTRTYSQLVPTKLPFYYRSICSARKLLSYSLEKLSRIIEARHCHDRWRDPLSRSQLVRRVSPRVSIYSLHDACTIPHVTMHAYMGTDNSSSSTRHSFIVRGQLFYLLYIASILFNCSKNLIAMTNYPG